MVTKNTSMALVPYNAQALALEQAHKRAVDLGEPPLPYGNTVSLSYYTEIKITLDQKAWIG
jgi:hypothetical protein